MRHISKITANEKYISFSKWKISFSNEVKEKVGIQFNEYTRKNKEVAGYFFFDEEIENVFRSSWVSTPNKKDTFLKRNYVINLKIEKKTISKNINNRRYLAIWHSHLTSGTDPSNLDIKTAKLILKELNEEFLLSLIFNDREVNVMLFYIFGKEIKMINKKFDRNKIWAI